MSAAWPLIALVAALALLASPPAARADGDPASDVLLAQDVFFPYAPKTSPRLRQALTALLDRTRRAGFPFKVALIESPGDLGANADLFDHPILYAALLSRELRTLRHGKPADGAVHLLVVMPHQFGTAGLGDRTAATLAPVQIDAAAQSDGLARAALGAVARLASSHGHDTPIPPEAGLALAPRHESTKRPGRSVLPFVLPVVLILLIGVLARRRSRHNPP